MKETLGTILRATSRNGYMIFKRKLLTIYTGIYISAYD